MRGIFYASIKKNIYYDPGESKHQKIIDHLNNLESDELRALVLSVRRSTQEVTIDHKTDFYIGMLNGKICVTYDKTIF